MLDKRKMGVILAVALSAILLAGISVYALNANIELTHKYNTLLEEANGIVESYNDLVQEYNDLLEAYNDLSGLTSGSEVRVYTEIHARIRIWKGSELILDEYHAGVLTKLGMNMTLAKLTGDDTFFNMTHYNLNNTYISIGDAGTLNSDSTVLPGEWNRTAGTVEDEAYNSYNLTATIHSGTGPYTADCIGINFEDGIGNNALYGYDTFGEVTNIDDSFTITIEFKVSIS